MRLLRPDELPGDGDPTTDPRLTAWEMVHQLARPLEDRGSLPGSAPRPRPLASCATGYALCEGKKRAVEALAYNGLVQSWPEIMRLARVSAEPSEPAQSDSL